MYYYEKQNPEAASLYLNKSLETYKQNPKFDHINEHLS